jgi:RNA polymerase sigma-70 factor (ECF subfamily)
MWNRELSLAQKIGKGDVDAWGRLVDLHYAGIFRFLKFLSGFEDAAGDLSQEVFLIARKSAADFRGESSLKSWLHKIAYRAWLRELRSRHPVVDLEEAEGVCYREEDRQIESILLLRALSQLSGPLRDAFIACEIQGLSIAEGSFALQIPEGTIKSRLFNARLKLRDLLSEEVNENNKNGSPAVASCSPVEK